MVLAVLLAGAPAIASADERDVVLVLDNSGSMRRNDPHFLALLAAQGLVERQPEGVRVALIAFDAAPTLAMPLSPVGPETNDTMISRLRQIDYRGRYTNLPSAMERALYHLRTQGRPNASHSIVFLTDGRVDMGDPRVDRDMEAWLRDDLAAAAVEERVRIFGVAFTENADFRVIETLTRRTNGDYVRVFSPEDLSEAFARIDEVSRRPVGATDPSEEPADETAVEASHPPVGAVPAKPAVAAPSDRAPPAEPSDSGGVAKQYLRWALMGAIPALALLALFFLYQMRRPQRTAVVSVPRSWLVDVSLATGQRLHPLSAVTVIGRRPVGEKGAALVTIDHNRISRRHARITFRDGAFWISDLGTRNGTYVNGARITDALRLRHGDRVQFEAVTFEFRADTHEIDDDATKLSEAVDSEVTRMSNEVIAQAGADGPHRR